jgi:hypothetical protein
VKILNTLSEHLRQGKSAFLIGPSGIGKTSVLRTMHARQAPGTRRLLYCRQASTLKTTLQSLAEELLAWDAGRLGSDDHVPAALRRLRKPPLAQLRRLVMPMLRSGRYAVLLDHVGLVRGAFATFLDGLVENTGVPIVAAVRSLELAETGRLWWVGAAFTKIQMPSLYPAQARRLIVRTLDSMGIVLPDRNDFIKELTRAANGNPGLLTRICELASAPRYQIGGRTNLKLLLLDSRLRDIQEHVEAESRLPLSAPVPE